VRTAQSFSVPFKRLNPISLSASRALSLEFAIEFALRLAQLPRQSLESVLFVDPGFSLKARNPNRYLLGNGACCG
jgi:hypothetical protein